MLYTAQANVDGFMAGEPYEMTAEDVERFSGLIEAGFLVAERPWARSELGIPEPEVLSTVGQPDPPAE